jgi:hypothetical protein
MACLFLKMNPARSDFMASSVSSRSSIRSSIPVIALLNISLCRSSAVSTPAAKLTYNSDIAALFARAASYCCSTSLSRI